MLRIIFYSIFSWRKDQVADRNHNDFTITRPRTSIKSKFCVRIQICFLFLIPSMDNLNPNSLLKILDFFLFFFNFFS